MTSPCDLVRERLDALLDGDLEPALRDHVVDCDVCRDLRHEARRAADAVRDAGADYVHPADFEARLLAAIDARPAPVAADEGRITLTDGSPAKTLAGATSAATTAPTVTAVIATSSATNVPASSAAPSSGSPIARTEQMPAHTVQRPVPSPPPSATGAPDRARRKLPRSPAFWVVSAAIAAAAATPFLFRATHPRGPGNTTNTTSPAAAAREAWRGRLEIVARASTDPGTGIEIKRQGETAFSPLAALSEIPVGAEIRTDPRTRARIALADGTQLVLDRASDLRFDHALPRTAALVTGALVADVAHIDGAPEARIALPTGGITVVGTKFALTAAEDRSTVRVTRGIVRMNSAAGQEVEVKTGEEGVLIAGGVPEVAPAVDLAESVAWSEFGGPRTAEPDAPILGLGELRARRPGHTDENDHQVTLAGHSVRVRIVGNVARTEIDETFRNDTEHELEGIYRFPLPPEAQIEKLSLDVRGRMEDGAFVDRQRAAAIWRGVIRNAVHPILQEQQTDELVWVPGPWRDPALLEWQRGGRFELRIFPIPAHGTRRVAIAYTQTIAPSGGVRRYVYPLAHDAAGSTRVEQFNVDVQVLGNDTALGVRPRGYALAVDPAAPAGAAAHLTYAQSGFVPAGDLVLEYALPDRHAPVTTWAYQPPPSDPNGVGSMGTPTVPGHIGLSVIGPIPTRASGATVTAVPTVPFAPVTEPAYVAIALRPVLPHWTESRPRDYALVVDTSRSMVGERLVRAARLVHAMIAEMDPRDRVAVLACDTTCRQAPGGLQYAGASMVLAADQFLAGEQAAGGSDLVAQVRAAAAIVGHATDRDGRIVYLGDGVATVGYRRTDLLSAEVAEAMPAGRTTLTTVALGHDADAATLGAMARAAGGVAVPYSPGESLQTAALSVLETTYGIALRDPTIELPAGLTETTPAHLSTLRAGGELLVAARLTGTDVTGEAVLRGTVAGAPFEQRFPLRAHATTDAGNSFVPRLYAAQRIADLEATDPMGRRDEIVSLSQRFHVPSRFTSLLVLESDAMYRAFGVRREAQNQVSWTGEQSSVSTVTGGAIAAAPAPAAPTTPTSTTAAAAQAPMAAADPGMFAALGTDLDRVGSRDENERASDGLAGLGTVAVVGAANGSGPTAGGGGGTGAGYGRSGQRANAAPSPDEEDSLSAGDVAANTASTTTRAPAAEPTSSAGEAAPAATPTAGPMARPARMSAPSASAPAPGMAPTGGTVATESPTGVRERRASGHASMTRGGMVADMPFDPRQQVDPQQVVTVTTRPRNGQWMRRIWVRRGAVSFDRSVRSSELARVQTARAALLVLPDSKTRHQELYRWLSIAGSFDDAADVANRWVARDALDPDALLRLADTAARRGERVQAIRILGGTVDVRPDDVNAIKRLVALHDRAGETAEACAYRISLAQVQANDQAALADATRCERTLGHGASALRLLGGITDVTLRARVDAAAMLPAAVPSGARGDIVLDANWDVPADLDLALIDPQGRRISWLGGRNTGITVRGARDARSEAIGLGRAAVGDYLVEISRAETDGRPVNGRIEVTVLGERRTLAFAFAPGEKTVRAGRITVSREEQLVPAGM